MFCANISNCFISWLLTVMYHDTSIDLQISLIFHVHIVKVISKCGTQTETKLEIPIRTSFLTRVNRFPLEDWIEWIETITPPRTTMMAPITLRIMRSTDCYPSSPGINWMNVIYARLINWKKVEVEREKFQGKSVFY